MQQSGGLSVLAQQVMEETHVSSRVSTRATLLTARYHALLLSLQVRHSYTHTKTHTHTYTHTHTQSHLHIFS